MAEVNGETSEWSENDFIPVPEEEQRYDIEWVTTVPEGIRDFLSSFEQGKHTGKLHFKFHSFTGEEYRLIYTIDFEVSDHVSKITGYSSMEAELPWETND